MDTGSPARTARTPARLKRWSITHKALAVSLCKAKTVAQLTRERVDAYVLPIFELFTFVDESGEKITSPRHLFLCKDETMCTAYYAQCDAAHRAHGFTGPEGHCPALTAESRLIDAENALLQAGCEFLGIELYQLYGDNRKQMLDLLLKACLSA